MFCVVTSRFVKDVCVLSFCEDEKMRNMEKKFWSEDRKDAMRYEQTGANETGCQDPSC